MLQLRSPNESLSPSPSPSPHSTPAHRIMGLGGVRGGVATRGQGVPQCALGTFDLDPGVPRAKGCSGFTDRKQTGHGQMCDK